MINSDSRSGTPEIYRAINAVQAELAEIGISKDRKNQQQGYNFRGIDDIYNALSGMMARHGLCILPYVTDRTLIERETKSGSALFYVTVRVEFHLVCSIDGSEHIVVTYGEAMDSADKATNKAMSAAYKYACLQTFCIPTEGDNDADRTTPEVAARTASPEYINTDQQIVLSDLIAETNSDLTKFLDVYQAESLEKFPAVRFAHAETILRNKRAKLNG